ncbi:arrestin domain-containing protein 17-like [Sitodiplosis mosellana]|uniref:arrestin domain-containing protein 17-like n=1 Tax=Sitodiplosis mosellana TaxID=263140 RepID=UPI0024450F20|nr:arrestin domain-containing protein 17-like [Sitodiplosis mosellana]
MDPSTDQSKSSSSPVDEKIAKLKIVLDNPNNTYYSGQTIHGTVYLNYSEIRGIHFRVIGKAKCAWTEWFVRESKPADGKSETSDSRYYGKEEHLNPAVYVVGAKNGPFITPEKSYRFSFELKSDLPSTFRSEYGEIKYKMKFVVDKRWWNEKQKITFKVIKNVNLSQIPATLQPFENQLTKTYGMIDSGPISLHVAIPKRGFILGEKIPITVTVANSSKLHVEKLKYFLYQFVEYHSTAPSERIRTDNKRILKKECDGVTKKSEQKFELVIDVPEDLPPSQDKASSRLIHIKYEVRVEAKLGTLQKNLVIQTPITIGTEQVTLRHWVPQPQSPNPVLSHVHSYMSLEILPHDQSNRSSVLSQFPISPMYTISPSYPVPISPSYPQAYVNSPIGLVSNPSIGSHMNRFSCSSQSPQQINPYQPTAPPISPHDFNASVADRPTSLFVPPSYDEACGNSQGLRFNQSNYTAPAALNNIPSKS